MNFLTRMIFEVAPDTISGYFLPNGSLADYECMTARPRKVSMKTQVAINQLVLIWSFSQQSVTEVWGSNFSFPNQKPPQKKNSSHCYPPGRFQNPGGKAQLAGINGGLGLLNLFLLLGLETIVVHLVPGQGFHTKVFIMGISHGILG